MPHLGGATSMAAHAVGRAGAVARWRLADGSVLTIACNLARESCPVERPDGRLLFASRAGAGEQALHGRLEGLGDGGLPGLDGMNEEAVRARARAGRPRR